MLTEEQLSALKNYEGNLSNTGNVFYYLTGKYPRTAKEEKAREKWNSPTPDEETRELKKRIPYEADKVFQELGGWPHSRNESSTLLDEINETVLAKYDINLKKCPYELEQGENYEKVKAIYMKKEFPNMDPTLDYDKANHIVNKFIDGQKIELYEYLEKTIDESTRKAFEVESNKRVKF